MERKLFLAAGILGVTAIIFGAFGAHALKKYLNLEQLATFETGVKYQMYHALFLLFVGTSSFLKDQTKKIILNLILTGIIFFSGSIYGLSTMTITNINFKFIGILTPIGGALLIAAWSVLCFHFFQKKV